MEKQFVTYEIALALKGLGFDKECLAYLNTDPMLKRSGFNLSKPFKHTWVLPLPLWQQALDWFREKHGINITIFPMLIKDDNTDEIKIYSYHINFVEGKLFDFNTWEEAREQAILKAIELCQKN